MSSLLSSRRHGSMHGLSSSPASDVNLQKYMASAETSVPLMPTPEAIEVEKKVEFSCAEAVREFEAKIETAGGSVVKKLSFHDCYYDSNDLLLTRSDHFLRDRDGVWELKVPRAHNSMAGSVYAELEGPGPIAAYFRNDFPAGHADATVVLPFDEELGGSGRRPRGCTIDDDDDVDEEEVEGGETDGNGSSIGSSIGSSSPTTEGGQEQQQQKQGHQSPAALKPFVEFATHRRRWNLWDMNIDVDEASFGACLAEFELMVGAEEEVPEALERIAQAMKDLGVVGAKNQDTASKFVKCIQLDEELLQRTRTHAPRVLDL
jgi:adenylate cyclase class IV